MFGRPVLVLKIKSSICPCLTSQEDNTAIGAINTLSNVSAIYYDLSDNASKVSAAASGMGKLVSGIFGSKSSPSKAENNSIPRNTRQGNLGIIDTMRGPALSITYDFDMEMAMNDENDDEERQSTSQPKDKSITLKRIGEISPNDSFMSSSSSGISIYTRKKHRNDEEREIFRLDLKNSRTGEDLSSNDRDEVIDAFKLIVHWDTERRSKLPPGEEDDNDDEDDNNESKTLGQRALKMKHFAQREIEMKRQRKDREDRKQRYLKDSGGLKYTAVAMANRAMT